MILKVRNEFAEIGWFIIDSIAELSYTWVKKSNGIGCDRHFDSIKEDLELESSEWVQMLITFKDRHEEVQLTEVTTYLLNDEGKTIERIHI